MTTLPFVQDPRLQLRARSAEPTGSAVQTESAADFRIRNELGFRYFAGGETPIKILQLLKETGILSQNPIDLFVDGIGLGSGLNGHVVII